MLRMRFPVTASRLSFDKLRAAAQEPYVATDYGFAVLLLDCSK